LRQGGWLGGYTGGRFGGGETPVRPIYKKRPEKKKGKGLGEGTPGKVNPDLQSFCRSEGSFGEPSIKEPESSLPKRDGFFVAGGKSHRFRGWDTGRKEIAEGRRAVEVALWVAKSNTSQNVPGGALKITRKTATRGGGKFGKESWQRKEKYLNLGLKRG